jgi:uncharacterized protein
VSAAAGFGLTSYTAWEARQYTLRQVELPLLPVGQRPLKVLHLSDIHMVPGQQRKQQWLASLAELEPDLVINTGDNLAHRHSVSVVVAALGGLLNRPGVFVLGSNDYYSPGWRNPIGYLRPDTGFRHTEGPTLPWPELVKEFTNAGWLDLTNTTRELTIEGTTFAFAGVDDPHLRFDDLAAVAGPAPAGADVTFGVAHAPYLRVLNQFAADGYDVIVAGHTHGGQVCLPGGKSLVTNCDLEPARAKGLHRHPVDSAPGDEGSSWLHVSAGIGTNPYVRFRLNCRPEATMITLTEAPIG